MAQWQIDVLEHQHRLRQRQVAEQDVGGGTHQHQRNDAEAVVDDIVQRVKAEVIHRNQALATVVHGVQPPQVALGVVPAVRRVFAKLGQ